MIQVVQINQGASDAVPYIETHQYVNETSNGPSEIPS